MDWNGPCDSTVYVFFSELFLFLLIVFSRILHRYSETNGQFWVIIIKENLWLSENKIITDVFQIKLDIQYLATVLWQYSKMVALSQSSLWWDGIQNTNHIWCIAYFFFSYKGSKYCILPWVLKGMYEVEERYTANLNLPFSWWYINYLL